jgi:hypothetical protein
VERGCEIDLPIEVKSNSWLDSLASFAGIDDGLPSYTDYFDDARLDQLMSLWFRSETQLEAAA